jgi:hypothetical protein
MVLKEMPTDILWKNLKDREGDRRIMLRRIGKHTVNVMWRELL